jgi:hypothetical protein
VATKEYWVQIEDHAWDTHPWGTSQVAVGHDRGSTGPMGPSGPAALVIRRYATGWSHPADEPVNPWDLLEPDPARTQGTLPGATLEAKVGDDLIVHFRNMDMRASTPLAERTHSLHPHGLQRTALHDGAYPLSPPDPGQGGARGDRVPPGGSFTYRWSIPHRSTAGAWLYHDQAAAHEQSLALGAFGVLRILAPGEQPADLPGRPVRGANDIPPNFAAVPAPPKRADYLLVFHELVGAGLCLNGRQGLSNAPALLAGVGTRMVVRCVNATHGSLTVHIHGHRWQRGEDWHDTEVLGAGGSTRFDLLSGSAQDGGGPGQWLVMGLGVAGMAVGSLVVTGGGALALAAEE